MKRRLSSVERAGAFWIGKAGIDVDFWSCTPQVAVPSNGVCPIHPRALASDAPKNRPKPSSVIAGGATALHRTVRSLAVARIDAKVTSKTGGSWKARVWPWFEKPWFCMVPHTTISLSLKLAPYLPFVGKWLTPIGPYGATSAAVSFTSLILSVKMSSPSRSIENTEKCPTAGSTEDRRLVLCRTKTNFPA